MQLLNFLALSAVLVAQIDATPFSCTTFPEESWRQGTVYQADGKDYVLLGYHSTLAKYKNSIEKNGLRPTGSYGRFGQGIYVGYDVPHLLDTYPLWRLTSRDKILCSIFADLEKIKTVQWCTAFQNFIDPRQDITHNAIKATHMDLDGKEFRGRPLYTIITPDLSDHLIITCEKAPYRNWKTFQPAAKQPMYAETFHENGPSELISHQATVISTIPGYKDKQKSFIQKLYGCFS